MENTFLRAEQVSTALGVSKSYAYKVIKDLNNQLKAKGRWRNKTAAFRMSSAEDMQLKKAVALSGLTKQVFTTPCKAIIICRIYFCRMKKIGQLGFMKNGTNDICRHTEKHFTHNCLHPVN